MSFFNAFARHFVASMEKRAAVQVHEHLRIVSDETLAQAGISKRLLAQGPSAYPWSEEAESPVGEASVTRFPVSEQQEIRTGVAELRACSDAELRDLGISRGEIEHVVRYGRPGIDQAAA